MSRFLRNFILLTVALSGFTSQLFAQSGINYRQQYNQAKTLYEQGNYQQAIELFQPISRAEKSNPFAPYASYFYAMAAFRTGDTDLAKNMFRQIQSKYPRWKQMPEVLYGLANSYYESGNFDQAFKESDELSKLPTATDSIRSDLQKMKRYYLARTPDEVLERLLLDYPGEKAVAEQLVTNITYSIYNEDQERKKDSLVERYSIDLSDLGVASQAASVRKEEYHLAAFLPFLQEKLDADNAGNRVGNQFILDLYRGMELAAKDLQQEGINVQLHAYDTQREYDITQELLAQDEIKYMDVFIGPLYQGPFRAVSDYARDNQKYMFNPLSSNPQIIGDNRFSYLIKPSIVTEAKIAAQHAIDSLDATQAVVVTGPTKRDSARVFTFINEFQETYNQEVHLEIIDDYNEETMELFVEKLQELHDLGETVVYVASDQELVITNTISAVVMSGLPLKVIGNGSWFDFTTISYEQLESLGVRLINSIYLDYRNDEVQEFRDRYRQTYYQIPSKNVFLGYDIVYFIGQMLNEYGVYFQEFFVTEAPVPSRFFQGYNYFQANDNQYVPIIQFEEGSLVITKVEY
ncbi:tetratricopeptide repeat protein [Tunicatimonas pelagia]|uniref:tetratricopeptide repeat protein n=1 Tax=Tunicatimonas pelagia TaxID=931531 RepID=UPI0026658013|nr:tetratricopeptide repeat protein [Tunicatimonas pelagia]WKN43142.1 tetratricopeptide repeat protein [Tunicatimonas pelagia]